MIDIFRIDTGDLVGSFATCGSPGQLDYHPLREEVWVHCSAFSNTTASHMDVFSAVSPAASIPATISLHDNTALRSNGKLTVAAELGDVAYSTVNGQPYLYKIDMAQRSVMEQYDMGGAEPNPSKSLQSHCNLQANLPPFLYANYRLVPQTKKSSLAYMTWPTPPRMVIYLLGRKFAALVAPMKVIPWNVVDTEPQTSP